MTKWKLVPENVVTGEMASAFAKVFSVRCQHETFAPAFQAAIEAAPLPPVLSDERILEIAMSDAVSLIEDQGPGVRPRITVHNSIGGVYAFARAIEREILGGGE